MECEAREKFTVCPNCSEAILRPQFDSHTSRCKQTKSKESHSMCPLCHVQIQDGEEVGTVADLYIIEVTPCLLLNTV